MPPKLRHEGAEIMTNEEPLKRNCHSENHKSEVDSDSNNSVPEIKALVNKDTLLPMMFLGLRKLGKQLLRTQNVSEQNQKHFLCPGHKICVHNKCCARGQTGKHLCRQQCVLVCQGLKLGFSIRIRHHIPLFQKSIFLRCHHFRTLL